MMGEDTIKLGFVGAGNNTTLRHLPGFQAIENVELVSVANRSQISSERVAKQWGLPSVYENWTDLISAPDTDAICIGTWPYMHRTLTLAALEHGKHVLCEARMAMDSTEAMDMLEASRQRPDLITQIVPAPMSLTVDATIIEMISSGYLGDLLSVDLSISTDFIDHQSPFIWRHDRNLSGNNIMTMGIWYEILMRHLGPANNVTALTRVNVKSRFDQTGKRQSITIPDQVEIICEMASGPITHMRISSVIGLAPPDSIWYHGTNGTLVYNVSSNSLLAGQRDTNELKEVPISPEKTGEWRVETEFINAIRGKEVITHTNFEDGLKYMEFTDAVLRSSQTGQTIPLPL